MEDQRKEKKDQEEFWWHTGLVILALFAAAALFVCTRIIDPKTFAQPCLSRLCYGWYCPGCGGTRAFTAFLHGHILKSFYYYPMVPYVCILYILYMGSQFLSRITKGRTRALRFRLSYCYIGLALFLLGWLGKNLFLMFGIELIP